MTDDIKEFIDDNEALARAKAAKHYNVSEAELQAVLVPPGLEIGGLAGRVVVLASIKRAAPELGAVGEFVRDLIGKMGIENIARIEERRSDDRILVSVDATRLAGMARDNKDLMPALSHLAERAAEKLVGDEIPVRVELAGRGPERGRGRSGDRHRGRDGGRDGRRERGRDRGPRRNDRGGGGGRGGDRGRGRRESADARDSVPENPELQRLALDSGRHVLETGEAATLDAMSSRDRWIVHNTLKELDGVESESVGEGALKRVKISPA